MIIKGGMYKHISCLDMNIYVVNKEDNNDSIKLTVMYVNDNRSLLWRGVDEVEIKKTELNKWRFVE